MHSEQPQEEWRRQYELFQAALELAPEEREALLASACAGSPGLREEVEALLAAAEAADPWIERSAGMIRRAASEVFSSEEDAGLVSEADAAARDQRIGSYRIVREIARGGMGTVYLAERADGQFEQRVAVKLLRRGLDTDDILARFLAERQILASLAHPNIARLFDGGATEDGRPYLVLEYVEGVPITDHCDARRLAIEQRLDLFTTVCRAVQHAHSNRVLHRDLKPSNILVTDDGRVKLLDFGIAKLLDDTGESPRTRPGIRLLTPDFASPEQLGGGELTAGSDVYQLGMLLYELLAGVRPYQVDGRSAAEVERIVRHEEVLPPSGYITRRRRTTSTTFPAAQEIARARSTDPLRLRQTLCGDLDAIVLKTLRKEPADRYATVEALIKEIERYRQGLAVQARRGTAVYRTRKLVRRNRAALTAFAGLLVGLLALVGSLTLVLHRDGSPAARAATPPVTMGQLAGAPPRPSAAYRFYEEGVRAYYAGDGVGARSFLRAAVAEDSTFALASYYLGLATPEHAPRMEHLSRALRFAGRAAERDRLLIRAWWARELWEPSLSALADSLVTRYPAEPEGHYLLGRARVTEGDFLGAIPHLERAVAMDSLGLDPDSPRCRACDALTEMIYAYVYADSFAAAERVARRWVDLQPESAQAWRYLGWTLWRQDRFEEAIAVHRTAATHRVGHAADELYHATSAVRGGDFAAADRLLRDRIRYGSPEVRTRALFWLTLSLRHQGQLREALATAREYRQSVAEGVSELSAGAQEAQVLFEKGRYREAAALFDSISGQPWSPVAPDLTPARNASRRVRGLTQAAAARAADGDLPALAALADTMKLLGQQSGLGIYRRLHHYPRGLLLSAQGRKEEAADEFRRAIFSPVASHPGPKLALARTLLELKEPREAVTVLQAMLRGPNAGPGAYSTRTEVYELLGHAWDAAGRPDSAAVHYRRVLTAWERADPQLHPRREAVRQRLDALNARIEDPAPTVPARQDQS